MSIHIAAAVKAITTRAVNDANSDRSTIYPEHYRPHVEACVAAETAELRCQLAKMEVAKQEARVEAAELRLANHELRAENARLKGVSRP